MSVAHGETLNSKNGLVDPADAVSPAATRREKVIYPLARLIPYIRRYPLMLTLTIVSLLVAAASTLFLPFAIRQVIDAGFANGSGEIDSYFQVLLVIVAVLAVASAIRFYCVYWLGERLVADLKGDVFSKLISLSAPSYDSNHSGE